MIGRPRVVHPEEDTEWWNCRCSICGKVFHKEKRRAEQAKVHFCSNACRWANYTGTTGERLPELSPDVPPVEWDKCALGKFCLELNSPERDCARCGFYYPEIERRLRLPLKQGKDGLWHKDIGQEK